MLVGDALITFGANGDYDVIIATAIKYAVVLALSFAFNIAQTWILQKTGQNIILQMRKDSTDISSLLAAGILISRRLESL